MKFGSHILHITYYLLFFFFVSCSDKMKKEVHPFEFYFDFTEEILRLEKENPVVKKSVMQDGKSETISDTINWKNELALFVEADINKMQFKDAYEILTEENSNQKKIKYIAKEKGIPVKLLELTYLGNEIIGVFIHKEVDNLIIKSKYDLHYFPMKGYRISTMQSIPLLYNEKFFIEGIFLNIKEGKWRAALKIPVESNERTLEIPFHFILKNNNGKYSAEILNAEEKILCNEVSLKKDSIFIKLPVFDSELKGKFILDTLINGVWCNYSKGSNYIIPFYAEYEKSYRFNISADRFQNAHSVISGKWEANFSSGTKDFYKAVGIFNQNGMNISGTFLTETGDYRYLEGTAANDTLLLSCFDGSHAFLFKAVLKNENILDGMFYSGIHWKEPFTAKKNEKAKLTNPDSLTFLKDGYSQLSFSFPDLDSNIISLPDKKFQNKVVIIPVMGSWCPNCLDETIFLSEIYKNHHEKGLEIVALSFERSAEFSKAKHAVKRFKEQLNAPYDFLIAGIASTAKANEALPMLNKIISFPTTIFIDRNGKVRKIHTGFYGPGTGEYYTKFKEETTAFIEKLLRE